MTSRSLFLIVCFVALSASITITWNVDINIAVTNDFNTALNWLPALVPGVNDTVVILVSRNITVSSSTTVGSLTLGATTGFSLLANVIFTTGNLSLQGGDFDIALGASLVASNVMTNGSGQSVIEAQGALNGVNNIVITNMIYVQAGSTLLIDSSATGSPTNFAQNLTVNAAGTLQLDGYFNVQGTTFIGAIQLFGTINAQANTTIPEIDGSSAFLTLSSSTGSVLTVNLIQLLDVSLNVSGNVHAGTTDLVGTSSIRTMYSNSTFTSSQQLTISSNVTGGQVITGAGSVILNGAVNVTMTSTYTINNMARLNCNMAVAAGSTITFPLAVIINSGSFFSTGASSSSSATVTVIYQGSVTFDTSSSTYAYQDASVQVYGTFTLVSGALNIGDSSFTLQGSANLVASNGSFTISGQSSSSVTNGATITVSNNATLTIQPPVSLNANVAVTAGTLIFTGNTTCASSSSISAGAAGVIEFGSSANLQRCLPSSIAGTIIINPSTNTTYSLDGSSHTIGNLIFDGHAQVTAGAAGIAFVGNVAVNNQAIFIVQAAITISGSLSVTGTGGVYINNPVTVTVANVVLASNFVTTVTVSGGKTSNGVIASSGSATLSGNAVININGDTTDDITILTYGSHNGTFTNSAVQKSDGSSAGYSDVKYDSNKAFISHTGTTSGVASISLAFTFVVAVLSLFI